MMSVRKNMKRFIYGEELQALTGKIFNIEKFRIHDGDGIRTAIFLKGCNLHCPWCCNPESQSFSTQAVVHHSLCTACLACYRNCPAKAVYYVGRIVKTNQELCTGCGRCVQVCPNSARQVYGRLVTADEVMAEVLKDGVYYSRSGGGVTLTGGEPLLQPEFAGEILRRCRREYFHTAIETAGFVPWQQAGPVFEFADTVLMDVKSTQPSRAQAFLPPQSDPEQMLAMQRQNILNLAAAGKEILFRCPIIPDYNDNERHIRSVAALAAECGVRHVDLLPFHQFGKNKYEALDREYLLKDTAPMSSEHLEPYRALLEKAGLSVTIGG